MATKHTCNGPVFGKLAPEGECARCDELHAGYRPRPGWGSQRRKAEAQRSRAIAHHFRPGGPHARGECGPVCTAFDA